MKPRSYTLPILLLYIALVGRSTYAAEFYLPQSMVVITTNASPLQHVNYAKNTLSADYHSFKIYNLDSIKDFEQTISQNLPGDEAQAKLALQRRINILGRPAFNAQLIASYQGVLVALKYQINRYPAILFNDAQVIYGVPDLKLALQLYGQWQQEQRSAAHD